MTAGKSMSHFDEPDHWENDQPSKTYDELNDQQKKLADEIAEIIQAVKDKAKPKK